MGVLPAQHVAIAVPPEAPGTLDAQQALAAWIRDPESAPAPAGIEPRRLKVYADLFFNNIESLLAATFPVARATLGNGTWHALVRGFIREHDAHAPVFTDLPRELLRYLEAREARGDADPPWLRELAHYEWIELALQISDARVDDVPHDPVGDLRTGVPVLSPLAWPLAYDWPVHRIGPDACPTSPLPTLLLVQREAHGDVAFHELGAVAWHLLAGLESDRRSSGEARLRELAAVVQAPEVDAFVDEGMALLHRYRAEGIVLGTAPA